jgi:thiosulfate reductase cytochrome b subunit
MKRIVAKHPLAIRWFHWINFPVLTLMIYSGLLIYWGYDPYRVELFGVTWVKFFPAWFYDALGIGGRLAEGMSYHFALMWLFGLNGLIYVIFLAWSGEWRHLLPDRHSFREAWDVVRHDLGLHHGPLPPHKFNAAQRIAYTSVIIMGAGSLISGLAIYRPVQFGWITVLLGGYQMSRLWHFVLTLGYVGFFLIHVIQVAKAGWNNFRAMVAGHELVETPEVKS